MKKLPDDSAFVYADQDVYLQDAYSRYSKSGTRKIIRSNSVTNRDILEKQVLYCEMACETMLLQDTMHTRANQNFLSVEYIISGEVHIASNQLLYIAEPGDLCFLYPDCTHRIRHLRGAKTSILGFVFRGLALQQILDKLDFGVARVIHIPKEEVIYEYFNRLYPLLNESYDLEACARNAGISLEMLQHLANLNLSPEYPELIKEVLSYFNLHYSEPINMGTLAGTFRKSLPNFNRIFRESLHMTPYNYLISLRMKYAMELLRDSDISIKEISGAVGYTDPSYFTSEFKRMFRCAPKEYRNNIIH